MTDRISKKKKKKKEKYNCIIYRWDSEKGCLLVEKKKIDNNNKKISLSALRKKEEKERQEIKLKLEKLFQRLPSINGAKATDGAESEIPKTFDQLTAEAVAMKEEEKQRQEIKLKVEKLFQLLPSINGAKATYGAESQIPKTFDQLTAEAVAMKEHLETHMNGKGSEFLLISVEYVIHMVACFRRETKLPPFDWNTRRYPKRCFKNSSSEHVRRSPLASATRTLSPPGASRLFKPSIRAKMTHHPQVEDNMCKFAKNGFKLSECGLALLGFGSQYHGIAQVNSVTGSETDKAYACIPSSSDPNRKLPQSDDVSLDGKDKKSWLEFKEFDKGNPEVMSYKVIQLDHPIVSVIGDFAVAAFNEACEMHVKKDEHNNLHDFEFMECKYLKLPKTYYFYMIIEAVEEGNLGVYETQVVCSSDGNMRILTKFLLTDRKPVGTKAMAISHFSCLRSVCKTLEGVAEEKLGELDKILLIVTGGKERGLPMHKLRCILDLRTEIIEGLHQLLFMGHSLLFSPDCSRTTNPDVWSHPDNNFYDVMVRRTTGTLCRGYDYDNPFSIGRGH